MHIQHWLWWARPNDLYRPESWSRTNNTFRIVIPVMVIGPRWAMSPSSVFGPLQNIYSPSCCWKDNSPLVHRRSVTKKEWISPLMSQWIKRRAPTRAQRCVYINRNPGGEKVRTHTGYPLHLLSIIFLIWATRSNFGIGGSVAGATPVQPSPFLSFFRIRIHKNDPILDDLIWLTIRASSDYTRNLSPLSLPENNCVR